MLSEVEGHTHTHSLSARATGKAPGVRCAWHCWLQWRTAARASAGFLPHVFERFRRRTTADDAAQLWAGHRAVHRRNCSSSTAGRLAASGARAARRIHLRAPTRRHPTRPCRRRCRRSRHCHQLQPWASGLRLGLRSRLAARASGLGPWGPRERLWASASARRSATSLPIGNPPGATLERL